VTPRTVVLFSGGVASWASARRIADRKGTGGMVLLFTDTMTEDEDLYRFLDEAAEDIGAPLVRLADGRDIWQVFRDERFLGNSRADPCSRVLKRDLSRKWIDENAPDAALVIGFDWTEMHRLDRARKAWAPREVIAPMADPPYRLRAEMLADLSERGIEVPRLYRMGFEHNNCGGGCVKAGQGHFARLLSMFPARYAEWEANEQGMREHLDADVSILRDRTGDGSTPLTLRALRERLEDGQSVPLWDVGGCGCFESPEAVP
jgi:hypothetical protein